jgi:cell fate regulator YaaT (PSP1 superfamily)
MSCKNCHKNNCITDIGRGCCFCDSGEGNVEISVCQGGQKLNITDWLDEMPGNLPDDIFEIHFKNTRKGFYKNVNGLELKRGDVVAVESSPGHDIGVVSLTGDLVYRQMKRMGFNPANQEFKKIYRKAKPYDIEKWQEAIAREHPTMIESRRIAADLGLDMKIGDVEYQGDRIKAIFYYIADERVDFRELIKIFADRFKIRVEMKQIGARQEAGRIGGIGACGRELCCASWISNFVSVTTGSARMQEISLNPQKLAGQCSKLKCCLIYELDAYMDARKEFPRIYNPLEAMDGTFHHVKNDIFAGTMYFSPAPNGAGVHIPLSIERVKEIIRLNKQGKKVDKLEDASAAPKEQVPDFQSGMGEDSITRFDSARRSGRGRGGRNRNQNQNQSAKSEPKPERQQQARKPDREKPDQKRADQKRPDREEGKVPRENGGRPPRRNNRNRKPQNEPS